jgi:hypothetical protein
MIAIAVLGCDRAGAMHAANINVAEMHPPAIVGFDDRARRWRRRRPRSSRSKKAAS